MNRDKKSSKIKYYATITIWFLVGLLISVLLGLCIGWLLYDYIDKSEVWGIMILGFSVGIWVGIFSDVVKSFYKGL